MADVRAESALIGETGGMYGLQQHSRGRVGEGARVQDGRGAIALVQEEGVELTDDDIAGVTGGDDWCGPWGCTKVNITDYL